MVRSLRFIGLVVILAVLLWMGLFIPAYGSDVANLTAKIDERISARWSEENVTPAPRATDAEFLRRASLDICGKIPLAAEVRDFIADDDPHKRATMVDHLLSKPSHTIHATNLWRAAMIPEAESEQNLRISLPGFEAWLRSRIAENRNFAEIVEEILTMPISQQNANVFAQPTEPTPALFYAAKEAKPERLAAATSRLFLGMRIDCAQCHDHPFDPWKQEQFWEHAAFFTDLPNIDQQQNNVVESIANALQSKNPSIKIPDTDKVVEAKFLDGITPNWETDDSPRSQLAHWIIEENNPYFAKAAVNRIWSHYFGIGLVEPMDDFSPSNPPSHPQLLEDLAQAFIDNDYDFKFMVRAITASQAYQLSSRQTDPSQEKLSLFARMPVRGLTPEQIFDSLAQATGYRQPFDPEQPINFNNDQSRQEFLVNFSNTAESAPDRTTTILQALSLMNGSFIEDATDLTDSRTLAAVIDAPFLDTTEKIDSLFLATLSRYPSSTEQSQFVEYVQSGGATDDEAEALADVFWALLNSSEFLLNH